MEVNILVGGAAGQGMDTVMNLIDKALVREGFGLIYTKDYMSRVRGGHNFSRLRIAAETPWSPVDKTDIIVALNEETYHLHRETLSPVGKVIYDPELFSLPQNEARGISVPAVFPEENSFAMDEISSGGAYSLIAAVHTRSANITQKHTSRGQTDFRVD